MDRNLVGVRELKTRLGAYLRRVRQGRTVVVTDRGQPVAELRPLTGGRGGAALARLQALGAVTGRTTLGLPPFRPIQGRGRSVTAAIREDRAERV